MNNQNENRWVARGIIEIPAAFHLGSGKASRVSDMAISRTAEGKPFIPGSSLAGLLRSAAEELSPFVIGQPACFERNNPQCPVCLLFGHGPENRKTERGGRASRIYVEDAVPRREIESLKTEIRDHVGMNRQTGAAQAKLQYDREVAPSQSEFSFEISIERPDTQDLRLVLAVLDLWQTLGFHLGGRVTTGLGEAKIQQNSLRFYGLNFLNDQILRDYLIPPLPQGQNKNEKPEEDNDELQDENESWLRNYGFEYLPPEALISRETLDARLSATSAALPLSEKEYFLPQHIFIDLAIAFLEPVVIASSVPDFKGARSSDKPFVRALRADGQETFILPGSSLKGILRTRAEKIVRTLNYYHAGGSETEYAKRICACAITHQRTNEDDKLGGCFAKPEEQRQAENKDREIYERSCLTCRLFGNSMMQGRLFVGEGRLLDSARAQEKLFDHVAIDRFTGGAADAKKYDARPLMPERNNEPIFKLRLHLERPEPWMLGLFVLLLKDLHDGDIRIGHATRRGYGKICAWVLPDARSDDVFSGSYALLLEGSEMYRKCLSNEVQLQTSGKIGPYYIFSLLLTQIFGPQPWAAAQPDQATPIAKLLACCHDDFVELLDCESKANVVYGRIA